MSVKTLLVLLFALAAAPAWGQSSEVQQSVVTGNESAALNTRLALRDLWVEHVFWIRNYANANQQGDSQQAEAVVPEVVANATAIANSLEPLYGQKAADQMLDLLAGHWQAVKDYSDAVVAKEKDKKSAAVKEITDNAKAIASFLAAANPNLPEDTLVAMLSEHGGHHMTQVDQLAEKNYTGEAKTWHAMREHILVLADSLTGALVKQFPDKF